MGKVYNTVEDFLSVCFEVTTNQPLDTRESVKTFDALLDKDSFGAVYETMKVLVQDEGCIYVLVSLPDAEEKNRWGNIGRQFVKKKDETTDLSPNKKLWKRLTIETITTKEALQRAKDNLVNGSLIYIANDITLDDGTTQRSGFYFCQNVNGTGILTMAGGSEIVNNLNTNSTGAALSAAMGKALNDSINNLKEYREMSIDFGKYEDTVTIAIMQPRIISSVKLVNVEELLLSYDGQTQQKYTSEIGQIDLGDSDYLVLEIVRTNKNETAVVGLTLKNK